MSRLIEFLLHEWQTATLMDYAHCVIAIIVVGWFLSRTQN